MAPQSFQCFPGLAEHHESIQAVRPIRRVGRLQFRERAPRALQHCHRVGRPALLLSQDCAHAILRGNEIEPGHPVGAIVAAQPLRDIHRLAGCIGRVFEMAQAQGPRRPERIRDMAVPDHQDRR